MSALISVNELKNRKNAVIIDCRYSLQEPLLGRQHYKQKHIKGALYADLMADLSSPVGVHGGRHPLPTAEAFSALCRRLGIVQGVTEVVVYDDQRFAFASRAWWLLRYFGHDKVRVLDGGFAAWQRDGGDCDDQVVEVEQGHFNAVAQSGYTANRQELLIASEPAKRILIDAREAPRYRGEVEPIDPIAGHIPTALNYPWQDMTNQEGLFNSRQPSLASLQGDIVVYCGSGVTACVDILALAELGKKARLYPGSWSDWCSYMVSSR